MITLKTSDIFYFTDKFHIKFRDNPIHIECYSVKIKFSKVLNRFTLSRSYRSLIILLHSLITF